MGVEVRSRTRVEEISPAFPIMGQLRTHLTAREYLQTVRRTAVTDGYRLAEFLAYGNVLYVDDLVTSEDARSAGHGKRMLASGVWRNDAHRFYEREGLKVSSYHFSKEL